ncbi:MAG: helix-turn-helix domain-containing protein [Acidobacteria bacterium]|nr:helix-turn-helix domain-containing protein [Acidobacteriota bacterium]
MEPLLLRPTQVADVLSISRTKVYELLKSRELPSVTIGGSVRVPTAALRQWVAAQTDVT